MLIIVRSSETCLTVICKFRLTPVSIVYQLFLLMVIMVCPSEVSNSYVQESFVLIMSKEVLVNMFNFI